LVFNAGDRFSGRGGGVIISHADITERKLAEIDLHDAYAEIEQLKNNLEAETAYLQEEIKLKHDFESIIGNSPAIQHVLFKGEQVAGTDTTVLVLGETGTGKELVARAIHSRSLRSQHPLVKVNCAPVLAKFFMEKASRRLGKSITVVATSVMNTLKNHPWPGNVRELENVVERAVISSSGTKLRLVKR
jgi:transcriptional regulator with GAF, ATPase, and Fis domain